MDPNADEINFVVETTRKLCMRYSTKFDELDQLLQAIEKLRALQLQIPFFSITAKEYENHFPKLQKFCSEHGQGFEVIDVPGYGRGVRATEDLPNNKVLMNIPVTDAITLQSAWEMVKESKTLVDLLKVDGAVQFEEGWLELALLTIKLMSESLNPDSSFEFYVRNLPINFTHPLFFTLDEFSLLEGSLALPTTIHSLQGLFLQYATVHRYLRSNPRTFEAYNLPRELFTFDFYRWAWILVHSRMVDDMLIPCFDLINHGTERMVAIKNVVYRHIDTSRVRTKRYIRQGEQILAHYNDIQGSSMHEFFQVFGFVEPKASVQLPITIFNRDPKFTAKAGLLVQYGLEHENHLLIVRGHHTIVKNEHFPLLVVLATTTHPKQKLTQENWERSWRYLATSIGAFLTGYDTSFNDCVESGIFDAEDEFLSVKEENSKRALELVCEEQRLLTWAKSRAEHLANETVSRIYWQRSKLDGENTGLHSSSHANDILVKNEL